MFSWKTMPISAPKVQEVDAFPTLDEVLEDIAGLAWERPDNRLVDFVTDDDLGIVVAVAIFAGQDLLITCSDGRRLVFEMPERFGGIAS